MYQRFVGAGQNACRLGIGAHFSPRIQGEPARPCALTNAPCANSSVGTKKGARESNSGTKLEQSLRPD